MRCSDMIAPRPNILWIIAEDLGPELGVYERIRLLRQEWGAPE